MTTILFVDLNTLQATAAKLPTSNVPYLLSPAQQKNLPKFEFLLRLGVHLQLTPINYVPLFSPPWGALAPTTAFLATPIT